jgi:hypothetical protein
MKTVATVLNSSSTKSSMVLLIGSSLLTLWFRLDPKIVLLILVLSLVVYFLGSITRLCAAVLISLLLYSALLGLIDVLGLNEQLMYPFSTWGQLILLSLFFISVNIFDIQVPWRIEAFAASLSFISVLILASRNIFQTGNAFAGIFPNEDNAAWVLTLHRAINEHPEGGGNFGPLLDVFLYGSHNLIEFALPDSSASDRFANVIVSLHMAVLLFVPFIAIAVMSSISKNQVRRESSISEIFILALGLQSIWIHFITSGHMSTGLSAICMVILLILLAVDVSPPGASRKQTIVMHILLAFAASSIWFPISPFALSILVYIGVVELRNPTRRTFGWISISLGISFIVARELLPRFDTFRTEDASLLSGAFNLLKMEGGVGSTGPYSFAWILLFLVLLIVILPIAEKPEMVVQFLFPMTVGLLTVVGLKIINLRETNGAVNYGARKYETVLIMIALVFFGVVIVRILSSRISTGVFALTLGVALSLYSQLPAFEQFLSGRSYYGARDTQLQQLGRAISENVAIGDDVVCIGEPAQTDRYLVYTCSRWTSAYTDMDDLIKNEWRKAVLGEIPIDMMPSVSEQLSSSTKVIVIGPEIAITERNPAWEFLIDENWEFFYARDH